MAVTMSDIAAHVGVDKSTISLVLSNKSKPTRTSEVTRKRILQAAKDMNYKPNLLARGLVTGKTQTVGLIACGIWCEAMRKKLERLHALVREKEYSFLLSLVDSGVKDEIAAIDKMRAGKVDGLIIITQATGDSNQHLLQLDKEGFPVVLFDSGEDLADLANCYVALDRIEASKIAVKHLLELGHRQIGHISPKESRERWQKKHGYVLAMQEHGLEPCIFDKPEMPSSYELGYRAVMENTGAIRNVTALFAYSDKIAVGAIAALKELDIRVPEDMAIVGFDNDDVGAVTIPPLTTIAQPIDKLAKTTSELLFDRIENSDRRILRKILLKPELVVRKSTGPVRKDR